MDVLDAEFLNPNAAEGKESDVGSHTVIIEDTVVNLDVVEEVAQVSVHDSADSSSADDIDASKINVDSWSELKQKLGILNFLHI